MAQEFGFTFSATGPADERDRLKQVIETHAKKQADGEYFVSTEETLGSPDAREGFCLVPVWKGRFDNVPVRTRNEELAMRGYSRHTPPLTFLEEVSRQYAGLECHLKCTDLGNLTFEHLVANGGTLDRVEFHGANEYTLEIWRWEKAGLAWEWKGERQHDLAMLRQFLRLDAPKWMSEEELADICERAYDAMALPGEVCPAAVTGHLYCVAEEIMRRRADLRRYIQQYEIPVYQTANQ